MDTIQKTRKKVLQTAAKHNMLQNVSHIVIGLSGGPDSVCLFDILRHVAEEKDIKLHAVHVNHGLRPGAADEDMIYVQNICNEADVPCEVFYADCRAMAAELKMTSEEAGRKVRYDAFSEVCRKIVSSGVPKDKIAIALAHNANDNAETVLFRIIRGTGTDGMAGIPYTREDREGFRIIRPLLDTERKEIEDYCAHRELRPRIDHTNSENIYTRNKIRNMLIPFIQENFNGNITEGLNRLSRIASCDRDFLRSEAENAFKTLRRGDSISGDENSEVLLIEPLRNLHRAVRMRVYAVALEKLGMEQNLTYNQAEGIEDILFGENPSASFSLSGGIIATREYDRIRFGRRRAENRRQGEWKLTEMTRDELKEYRKTADAGKIFGVFPGVKAEETEIRTRRPGDIIRTGNGTKKIREFLIDEKVPKAFRDSIFMLTKGNEVLWVLPSEHFPNPALREKGRFAQDAARKAGDTVIVLEKL